MCSTVQSTHRRRSDTPAAIMSSLVIASSSQRTIVGEQGEHGGQTETQANEASSSFSHRKTPLLHHVDSGGQKKPAASRMKYELIMFFRSERCLRDCEEPPRGCLPLIFLDEFGSPRNCLDHHVGKVHHCPGPLCRPPSRTAPVLYCVGTAKCTQPL